MQLRIAVPLWHCRFSVLGKRRWCGVQGEIAAFLSTSRNPSRQQAALLSLPSCCDPASATEGNGAQRRVPSTGGWGAGSGLQQPQQPEQQQPVQRLPAKPGSFDDDFIMSIKLGTDFQSLQRQAAAAAAAGAPLAAAAGQNYQQQAARWPSNGAATASETGGSRLALAASDVTASAGKSEAIDRLKGLRWAGFCWSGGSEKVHSAAGRKMGFLYSGLLTLLLHGLALGMGALLTGPGPWWHECNLNC